MVLISNTRKEMQEMLKLTENFGNKIELKFNPTKTNFMTIMNHLIQHQENTKMMLILHLS